MWWKKKKNIETALLLTINDLSTDEKRFAFRLLVRLFARQITPFQFQIEMLLKLGYKPRQKNELERHFFIIVAENLSLLFKIIGNEIILDYDFTENPFPILPNVETGRAPSLLHTPTFTRNLIVDTNITARQFADCLDYLREINKLQADENFDAEEKGKSIHFLLAKITETLYKIDFETAQKVPFEVLFAVQMWFAGISAFFHKHPIYSILFRSKDVAGNAQEDEQEKISLGMSETILHLIKEGYTATDEMNVVDFFNAQIKSLKDSIAHAIAEGAKKEDLCAKMQIDFSTLNKLL